MIKNLRGLERSGCAFAKKIGVIGQEEGGRLRGTGKIVRRDVAAEIEDDFSLLIADIATRLLKQDIDLIVVLPKVLQ